VRVLITSDAVGGVSVISAELSRVLTGRGHQVEVTVFALPRFRLEWMDSGAPLISDIADARTHLAAAAAQFHPDVVQCNQFAFVGAVPGVPSILSVHSDVVSWWRWVEGGSPPDTPFQRWYRRLALTALEQAAAVVTPTRAAAADLFESFGFDRQVEVIPNALNFIAPRHAGARSGAVSLGRIWDAAKQFPLIAEAAQLAGIEVAIAGDRRHPVSQSETPLPNGLRWFGCLDRAAVARLLGSRKVYVAASRYEPFGLAPLEAAHAGCALLLTDLPSLREIWGDAAIYFDRDSSSDLARNLSSLLSSPVPGAQSGFARAQAFSPSAMAASYESLYANSV